MTGRLYWQINHWGIKAIYSSINCRQVGEYPNAPFDLFKWGLQVSIWAECETRAYCMMEGKSMHSSSLGWGITENYRGQCTGAHYIEHWTWNKNICIEAGKRLYKIHWVWSLHHLTVHLLNVLTYTGLGLWNPSCGVSREASNDTSQKFKIDRK